jgi:hypothetical protein
VCVEPNRRLLGVKPNRTEPTAGSAATLCLGAEGSERTRIDYLTVLWEGRGGGGEVRLLRQPAEAWPWGASCGASFRRPPGCPATSSSPPGTTGSPPLSRASARPPPTDSSFSSCCSSSPPPWPRSATSPPPPWRPRCGQATGPSLIRSPPPPPSFPPSFAMLTVLLL